MPEIIDADPSDVSLIAWGVAEAIGKEILSGWSSNVNKVENGISTIFTFLAGRDDSQYSYLNTRIVVAPDGTKAGVCISYKGSDLKRLRKSFYEEANKVLGWNVTEEEMETIPGETSDEEYYLDTLAILPEYRGRGYSKALIEDALERAVRENLPLGLLVADDNNKARNIYEKMGFKPVGRRLFAGEEMTNMRITPNSTSQPPNQPLQKDVSRKNTLTH